MKSLQKQILNLPIKTFLQKSGNHNSNINKSFNNNSLIRYSKFNFLEDQANKKENPTLPKYLFDNFINKISLNEIRDTLENSINISKEKEYTPSKIKQELDKYVIGQDKVKKAIANALRNRYRKRIILEELENESKINKNAIKDVYGNLNNKDTQLNASESSLENKDKVLNELFKSHNILISGKSGSGKTELIRETAKLCNSPFIKVDAVRYTEVGYYGDDVENIITNLYQKTFNEFEKSLERIFWEIDSVKSSWEAFILQYLLGNNYTEQPQYSFLKNALLNRELENLEINIWFKEFTKVEKFFVKDIRSFFWERAKYKIQSSLKIEDIVKSNIEQRGIVCIDEFDKLIRSKQDYHSSTASNEGVQNDFLPLFDGSDIPVKEGKQTKLNINTKNILFIALGAFTKSKPTDLITEIQGRLPIQVSVDPLLPHDFKKILKESNLSALNQIIKLLKTEGLHLEFTDEAIDEICEITYFINQTQDDTGARRLVSVLDTIIDEISYFAPEIVEKYSNKNKEIHLKLDAEFVKKKCGEILKKKKDMKKYIA